MAGNEGFRLLFWVRDCGLIVEEPLDNFAQGWGSVVRPRPSAEFVAKGVDRFNLGFDGARRGSRFLGEIGVNLIEWRIAQQASV